MAILPIVTFNDPLLRIQTKPVSEVNPALGKLIEDMFETMYNASGIGLAAPQVGREESLFVIDADSVLDDGEKKHGPMAFINPEIVASDSKKVEFEEGCLSLPGLREKVKRPDEITVRYKNAEFQNVELKLNGWMSRVVQHELDHLKGVLFIDYLGSFRRRLIKSKLDSIRLGQVEPDYPLVPKDEPQRIAD